MEIRWLTAFSKIMSAATEPIKTSPAVSQALKKKKNLGMHLVAGGVAGCCEALSCHPLDTIKVRLQLRGERQIRTKPISLMEGNQVLKSVAAEGIKVRTLRIISIYKLNIYSRNAKPF